MTWDIRKKMMLRWSSLVSGVFLVLWSIWYLINGSVPEVTSIDITKDWIYVLPFSISRWWDVILAPLFTLILVLVFTSEKVLDSILLTTCLVIGSFIGLSFSLVCGVAHGFMIGFLFGFVAGFVLALLINLAYSITDYFRLKTYMHSLINWLFAK